MVCKRTIKSVVTLGKELFGPAPPAAAAAGQSTLSPSSFWISTSRPRLTLALCLRPLHARAFSGSASAVFDWVQREHTRRCSRRRSSNVTVDAVEGDGAGDGR